MKAAVNSLKTHVTRAREKFDESNEQLGTVARERVEMSSKIAKLEQQSQFVKNQAAEIAYLREVTYTTVW
jgi:chromosome segregation ATPase